MAAELVSTTMREKMGSCAAVDVAEVGNVFPVGDGIGRVTLADAKQIDELLRPVFTGRPR